MLCLKPDNRESDTRTTMDEGTCSHCVPFQTLKPSENLTHIQNNWMRPRPRATVQSCLVVMVEQILKQVEQSFKTMIVGQP